MPARLLPLVNGETYHTLNRGVAQFPIFKNRSDYKRFLDSLKLCRFQNPPVNCSRFINLSDNEKIKKLNGLVKQVEILAYCLMPNHFHLILKQNTQNGIYEFVHRLATSYGKYFNKKYKRKGPLFEGRFKAIRVDNEPQLLHLGRYIHLNPYSASLVKNIEELIQYPYSSLGEYLQLNGQDICQKDAIAAAFNNNVEKYKNFVVDRADYQKHLQIIKDQILE